MKKITVLIVFGVLGFVNIADARWFATMAANPVYNYTASLDLELSFSGTGVGLGGGSAGATLVGTNYECEFGLSSCNESQQKFVKIS